LLIGASTGGPQAVMTLLKAIRSDVSRVPVFIAQHMPAAFTMMFAEHLSKHAQLDVVQATDGEAVKAGRVYVAPGGRHMQLKRVGGGFEISIVDTAPVNFCKPAVDVLFDSASELIGAACLAVVLTGMGVDGARGALHIAEAGGNVLAQDEATSVVWGMPGATSRAGACAAVLPIVQMAPVLSKLLAGERP
jgi:two-component system chemotaxis response regulator CheB